MHRDEHDQGLAHDLKVLTENMSRRPLLRWLAGASLLPIVGCGDDGSSDGTGSGGSGGSAGGAGGSGSCAAIPEETAGPYPGDGSNGANALTLSGIVRSDIRSSIGTASGTAEGVPLTVELTIVTASGSCAPLAGYAVYVWQCDRDSLYSMYTLATENYLRGVQETNSSGVVTFTTVFPGCYPGRWPHIHFEVYPSLDLATEAVNKLATSQLALPEASCAAAYAEAGYEASVTNLAGISLASDGVFSDGSSAQVASVTGSASEGFVATLTVAVSA